MNGLTEAGKREVEYDVEGYLKHNEFTDPKFREFKKEANFLQTMRFHNEMGKKDLPLSRTMIGRPETHKESVKYQEK